MRKTETLTRGWSKLPEWVFCTEAGTLPDEGRVRKVSASSGHASIQLTVDTYGKWLPMGNKAAVNRLDEESGSRVVAKTTTGTSGVLEVPAVCWWALKDSTLGPAD